MPLRRGNIAERRTAIERRAVVGIVHHAAVLFYHYLAVLVVEAVAHHLVVRRPVLRFDCAQERVVELFGSAERNADDNHLAATLAPAIAARESVRLGCRVVYRFPNGI